MANHEDKNDYEIEMPDKRRLLKLAYIYGANASGKTTVLKAFELLRKLLLKPISEKATELDFEPFLFCDSPHEKVSRLELSFYVEGQRYAYNVEFNKQAILEERVVFYQSAKPTELFFRTTDLEKRLSKIQFGSKIKVPVRERDLLESNTLHNNTVIGAYAKTNVDIGELEVLNKWFNSYFLGMITSAHDLTEITVSFINDSPEVNQWVNTFLNKADYQISQVDVSSNLISIPIDWDQSELRLKFFSPQRSGRVKPDPGLKPAPKFYGGGAIQQKVDFVHKVKDNRSYSLPLLAESNGTKRYFGLGGPLYALTHESHILCIDELDSSLHPDLMKHFLQVYLLNAKNSQLLITTHNISLMENLDFMRRDALWFSEKKDDGSISLYSAADFDTSVLRKDASIINAYKSGRLGAKPNLGSPYLIEE